MVTFLSDDLSPTEWNRRRNLQASGADPNGGIDPNAPIYRLHDGLPAQVWQKVRAQQVGAHAPAAALDPKVAAARDYGAHHILDLIPIGEGTSSYDASFNNGDGSGTNYPRGWNKPTELTIDQAIAMAPDMERMNGGHYAIGMFQFKPDTLSQAKVWMNLSGSERLTGDMQQRIARELLHQRGYDTYLASGKTPDDLAAFQTKLVKEWPSLPNFAEAPQSDGIRVRTPRISPDDFRNALVEAVGEADHITDTYIDAGQTPPDSRRWREPKRVRSRSPGQ
jgi:hypothetical protein